MPPLATPRFRLTALTAAEEWAGAEATLLAAEAGSCAWALVWNDANADTPVAVMRRDGNVWVIDAELAEYGDALVAAGRCVDAAIEEVPLSTVVEPIAAMVIPRERSLQGFFRTAGGIRTAEEMLSNPGQSEATTERWTTFTAAMEAMKLESEFDG